MYQFAAEEGTSEEKSLTVEIAEKAKEFVEKGSEIYQRDLPEGAKVHH